MRDQNIKPTGSYDLITIANHANTQAVCSDVMICTGTIAIEFDVYEERRGGDEIVGGGDVEMRGREKDSSEEEGNGESEVRLLARRGCWGWLANSLTLLSLIPRWPAT